MPVKSDGFFACNSGPIPEISLIWAIFVGGQVLMLLLLYAPIYTVFTNSFCPVEFRGKSKNQGSPTPEFPIDPNEPTYCLCNQVRHE